MITDSTKYMRSTQHSRHQECFAVRPGVNQLLDVARKTFSDNIEDIVSLAEALSAEHGIECKLQFSLKRGYHLNVPRRAPADEEALPDVFIAAVGYRKVIACTTEELAS